MKELHSATNNFNYDNKLGEGGFGSVYWGQLWDGSQVGLYLFFLFFVASYLISFGLRLLFTILVVVANTELFIMVN